MSRFTSTKTTLIGQIRGPPVRAYAYTADDIDNVIGELARLLQDRLPPSGLTQEELLEVKGVGENQLTKYGADLLSLINPAT